MQGTCCESYLVYVKEYLVYVAPWTKIFIRCCCSWSFFNKLLRKILRRRCIGRDLRWKCIFSGSTLTIPENIGTDQLGNEPKTLGEGISYPLQLLQVSIKPRKIGGVHCWQGEGHLLSLVNIKSSHPPLPVYDTQVTGMLLPAGVYCARWGGFCFSNCLSRWWVLHWMLPSFPFSALYSTKVGGRPTFHWTFGFRRCLWNCKTPLVDQSFI